MAANINDKFSEVSTGTRPTTTTVASIRSAAGTSLVCDDLTGWATDTAVHFVTYQVDGQGNVVPGTQTDMKGIVNGNTIDSIVVTGGTDNGNSVGDIVQQLPTAAWAKDLADGLLVSHNQDGTLKLLTDSGNGTLNFAGGSPTGSVRYVVAGGICTVTIAITINSAITGNYNAIQGLPSQHSSVGNPNVNDGWVVAYRDASANTLGAVTLGIVRATNILGTFRFALTNGSDINATGPFTWAAGDTIFGSFSYPVA